MARVFVDATYEGDVALGAGAAYRIGREGREELGESHAGVVYQDFHDRRTYPGSTGAADRRIQAYNYRLCLTDDPENRRDVERPADYDRSVYSPLVDDVRSGRMPGFWGPRGGTAVLNFVPMPNRKSDANNHHYCFTSSDWTEANFDYPEAGPERRLEIAASHRAYTEGLVWFCQNDEELPADFQRGGARVGAGGGRVPGQRRVPAADVRARGLPDPGRLPVQRQRRAAGQLRRAVAGALGQRGVRRLPD